MKKIILFLFLGLIPYFLASQEFPNLDFSNMTPDISASDPFSGASSWEVLGGTPQLSQINDNSVNFDRAALLLAGNKGRECFNEINSSNLQCVSVSVSGEKGSESLSYAGTFLANQTYLLSFSYKTQNTPDRIIIGLANDLVPDTNFDVCTEEFSDGTVFLQGRVSGDISGDITSIVWEEKNSEVTSWTSQQICIIPDIDYSQLVFTIVDNDVDVREVVDGECDCENSSIGCINTTPSNELAGFWIGDLEIETGCQDDIFYSATETTIFPAQTNIIHYRLPLITHVNNNITARPDDGNILIKYEPEEGVVERVKFKSGGNIIIEPSLENPNKVFRVDAGAYFLAKIEDCTNESPVNDICANFIPAGSPPGHNVGGFQYVQYMYDFAPFGDDDEERIFYFRYYNYAVPYNAYYAKFEIFNGNTSNGLVYSQTIDNRCAGLEPAEFYWNGCQGDSPLNSGLYTYYLYLENCYDSALFEGSVAMLTGGDCSNYNSPPINQLIDVDDNSITAKQKRTIETPINPIEEHVNIYPNIGNQETLFGIEYTLMNTNPVEYYISDINGNIVYHSEATQILNPGVHFIYLKGYFLGKGMFILNMRIGERTYTKRMTIL